MGRYKRIITLIIMLDFFIICAGMLKYGRYPNDVNSVHAEQAINDNTNSVYASNDIDFRNGSIDSFEGDGEEDTRWVIPSGEPIGIYVKSEGVMVIGVGHVTDLNGDKQSPCDGLIGPGDYILSIEGEIVEDKAELTEIVNASNGECIEIAVQKKQTASCDILSENIIIETVTVSPVEDNKGNYMLGLWVKDDISGIGTLTYYDENSFGALGHSINDNDTGEIFEISDGAIYKANLINIVKPNRKIPGRLEGMIDYSSSNMIGRVEGNSGFGVNGYITKVGRSSLPYEEYMPVGHKSQVKLGKAYLLSSVSGKSEYYEVEIIDIIEEAVDTNKQLQLRITDSRLMELTSGIVQGMSGTPIIQDGKLIGAVTHVLVSDPTTGYGIFIENMLGK